MRERTQTTLSISQTQALEILESLILPGSQDLDIRNKEQVRPPCACLPAPAHQHAHTRT